MVLEDGYRTHAWCWLRGQEKRAPPGRFPSCPASSHRLKRCMKVANDATAVKTRADYTALIRDSQAALMASAERITVVGRWVVLAAAVILNHFGNQNSSASVCRVRVGGMTSFARIAAPPGFVVGRVFLCLFLALVAGLLVGDIRNRLDRALLTAIERATQLDETQRREALEKERAQRLEEIDHVRSDFVSVVAHELQTPLASIKTQADTLLTQQHRLDQETRGALVEGIHKSAASLSDLVQDFATVNRIENHQFTYHFEDVRLDTFVPEVLKE